MDKAAPAPAFNRVRNVSGFSRAMSPWDAFIYNFLTMGVIFPWTYLWGPASFPGANIELGIWLTLLAQIPISFAYCFLASALPVTGGDYVYQTRAFGKWGFVLVMSGFVIWILQWIALSGWLFTTLGLAPWLMALGVFTDSPTLTQWGLAVQSPWGVFLVSIALAFFTTLFLIRGLRLYVKIQRFLFASTLAAIGGVAWVFLSSRNCLAALDDFVHKVSVHASLAISPDLATNFTSYLLADVQRAGGNIDPTYSLLATLGIVPIAWTSLQWATYSVEQNTEISEADKFRKQVFILVGSAVAVAFLLYLVAYCERVATSREFMNAASSAYWTLTASEETVTVVKTAVQPFPNIIAMAASGSLLLASIIALGFIANAFQVTCNCFIGVTRIIVAMGTDGLLPRQWGLERVDPVRHAPVRAHWVYFIASIPWIIAYNFVPNWVTYTLGVTFACGYVFAFSALAATKIPTKMNSSWRISDIHGFSATLIRLVGYVGFGLGIAMVLAYLVLPQLGLTGDVPYLVVAVIIVISYVLYIYARAKSPLVDKVLEEPPGEIDQFFLEPDKTMNMPKSNQQS